MALNFLIALLNGAMHSKLWRKMFLHLNCIIRKLLVYVQGRLRTFSDMWALNYFPCTFSQRNTWGFAPSEKKEYREREYRRISQEIRQSQDHGKEFKTAIMLGLESNTLRMGKIRRLQERFILQDKIESDEWNWSNIHLNVLERSLYNWHRVRLGFVMSDETKKTT